MPYAHQVSNPGGSYYYPLLYFLPILSDTISLKENDHFVEKSENPWCGGNFLFATNFFRVQLEKELSELSWKEISL